MYSVWFRYCITDIKKKSSDKKVNLHAISLHRSNSYFWLLELIFLSNPTPQCFNQEFFEKYIVAIFRQNILKLKIKGGGALFIPLIISDGQLSLNFQHLKCNFSLNRILFQHFWLSKLISCFKVCTMVIPNKRIWWKKIVRSCIRFLRFCTENWQFLQ